MSDERLNLADEYEAGLRKMESAGYEEFGPTIEKHNLVIAALRAPSPSGSAGAMREALEQRKKEIAADIERFDWKPPTPAWHRAFGELSGINFALAAAPQAQEDEAFKLLSRTFQSAKLPPKLELDIGAFLSSHSRPERGDPA